MNISELNIPGVFEIRPKIFSDKRGYFFESYNSSKFSLNKLDFTFIQDNQSFSTKGVVRGLHYQLNYPQGKLVSVARGAVMDVAVDIRIGSPTFGQHVSKVLDDKGNSRVYVPPGFAHGFIVLSENAIFQYKCTGQYHPEDEYGLRWDDMDLGINWGSGQKIISDKDSNFKSLKEINSKFLPKYEK